METAKNLNRSSIFTTAWQIVRTYGETLVNALRRAWALAKLRAAMASRVVRFYFTKVDGSVREAWGTLSAAIVPAEFSESGRKPSPSVFTYYDTEKTAWRCFKIMNLHI